jgi:hypothetical protein
MRDKEWPRMAPQIRMNNRLLPSSSDLIALGAGMNTNGGNTPDTFLRDLAIV